jgi:hypothetical protein
MVLVASGCGMLGGANKTLASLRQAGYRDAGVHIETGSGLPHDGLVDISYSAGPPGASSQSAALNAAHIAGETLGYRFGGLVVTKTSGGCTGPICVSHSTELGGETYAQLATQFGPRPAGLDAKSASNAVHIPACILPVALLVLLAAIVAIVRAVVRKRRRPPFQPPWLQADPLQGIPQPPTSRPPI